MEKTLEEKIRKICKNCEYLIGENECEFYTEKYGCPKLNEVFRDNHLHQGINYARRI